MKFCMPHWAELKTAIDIRGLSHLVAKDGKVAADRLKDELMGVATKDTYDPLMNAHNMITCRALEAGGLYLLTGDFCPLCELDTHLPALDEKGQPRPNSENKESTNWINGCTDSVLNHCQELKLV